MSSKVNKHVALRIRAIASSQHGYHAMDAPGRFYERQLRVIKELVDVLLVEEDDTDRVPPSLPPPMYNA